VECRSLHEQYLDRAIEVQNHDGALHTEGGNKAPVREVLSGHTWDDGVPVNTVGWWL
jgi:hypothetical protein